MSKILTIDEIEEVLFDGSEEEIKGIIKEYEVNYEYDEQYNSFTIESKKLNEISKGNGCHYKPNCVTLFGNSYGIIKK